MDEPGWAGCLLFRKDVQKKKVPMKRIVYFVLSLWLVSFMCDCGGNLPRGTEENLQMIVNCMEQRLADSH